MAKEGRSLAIIHNYVSIKILNLKTAKEVWDKLKEELQPRKEVRNGEITDSYDYRKS